jgi:hypothetical protein
MLPNTVLTNHMDVHSFLYMPNGISHDRNKPRTFWGEQVAAPILHWLNAPLECEPGLSALALKQSKKRVLQIISHMRGLQELTKLIGVKSKVSSNDQGCDPVALNRMLAGYTSSPRIFTSEAFLPKDGRQWVLGKYILSKRPPEELIAVEAIIQLAEQNRLDRLQVCECGQWYFAKFSHQKFCSTECRVRFWESSEERMEQKRERARQNYVYNKVHKGK